MAEENLFQYLHGAYKLVKDPNPEKGRPSNDEDAVIACVKDVNTGETKLKYYINPKRNIYITNKGMQSQHNRKKEFEWKQNLDSFSVPNANTKNEVAKRIGLGYKHYVREHEVYNNPYVYGATIDIDVLIKQSYAAKTDRVCKEIRVGGLDIETSVRAGKEIMCCTYTTHDNISYCAYLTTFLKPGQDSTSIANHTQIAIKKLRQELDPKLLPIFDKYAPEVVYYPTNSELDLMKWIFSKIHQHKDEFISVWNINFDIPYFIKRCNFHNLSKEDLFCHPEVPKKWRTCEYKEDKSKLIAHFSHRWHTFNVSGYTQFYDGMALYSRLRRTDGNLASYQLKDIAKLILGTTKLNLGEATHYVMQSKRYDEYIAYNIIDAILLPLMEKVIRDVPSLLILIPETTIPKFSKQTAQLMDVFHANCLRKNAVAASCAGSLKTEYDDLINNIGGGVLDPSLAKGVGTVRLLETDTPTNLCIMVSDIDVAAEYPSLTQAMQISKQCKRATVLAIDGFKFIDINDFFGHYVAVEENCVAVGNKFFNLPTYSEAIEEFRLRRAK